MPHLGERCQEIGKRIDRIKAIAARITDQQTIDGAVSLVAELEAEKAALHPEQREEK